DAAFSSAFACWDVPFVGRGLDQQHTGGRAALTDVFMRGANTAAAAGGEISPHALACDVLPGSGIFGRDLRPIAVELLSHELRESGKRTLSHLGAGNSNDNGVVRMN